MDSATARTLLDEAESRLAQRVREVELLGEITIGEADISNLSTSLGTFGLNISRVRWRHCLAVCLVGVARFQFDGDSFWPHLRSALGAEAFSAPQQQELGQWFESYLATNRLPKFSHLVEQGALRYLTPILAHALVPRALVPSFLEYVVWPSVIGPEHAGGSAEEIQQRMARSAPPQIPRSLRRFTVYGGRVARDIIDRSMLAAACAARGEDQDDGLPPWLQDAIRDWVSGRTAAQRKRAVQQQRSRRKVPVLRFDPMYRRVQVELPHPDERDATWEVHLPDGQVHEEKWKPSWQRTAAVTAVGIERPFVALNVTLQGHASILGSWSFGGLRDSRPALFFDGRSGRALGSSEYLSGNSWFLIMPKGGILHADGNRITPTEALGEPFGNWPGLVAERYEASAATELRLDLDGQGYRYRLVAEAPGAMLEAPPMPAFLAPLEDAVLAFESELPVVRLPAAPDGADGPAYLQRWSIELATRDGATVEQRSADTLRPEQQLDGSYRVRLEELVPGPDVGDWDLEVAGPLGRGLSRGLSLLPDMRFEVEDRPGIAGPELRASRVFAQTRDGVRVLEEGDVAAPALGGWFLRDQNRNGRIPFTVEDSRTGREATAMIRLSTIQWQWTSPGVHASPQNVPQRFAIDDLQPDTAPRLLASNAGASWLRLRLVDSSGQVLQEESRPPLEGRGSTFELRPFLTTAGTATAASLRLRLELVASSGELLDSTDVAQLARNIEPRDVRAEFDEGGTIIRWVQARSFPGTTVTIGSLSRPWDESHEAEVESEAEQQRVRFADGALVPGRYEMTLWHDDGWVGRAPLGPAVEVVVGSPTQIRQRIDGLPPTANGRLEEALLARDAQSRGKTLRDFADEVGPYQLAEVAEAMARALKGGRAAELLALPWHYVADRLAVMDADPLPLIKAIAAQSGTAGLDCFCASIGLDRWPALLNASAPTDVRRHLWAAWGPLGAFAELRSAPADPDAALRCLDALGWCPGPRFVCAGCGGEVEAEQRCSRCSAEAITAAYGLVPEPGSLSGPDFVPEGHRLRAMRAALSPLPGTPFDTDGWIVASLAALEGLAGCEGSDLDRERDARITDYLRCLAPSESRIAQLLRRDWLGTRKGHPRQYPWAFVARVSLATALLRRLMARRKLQLDSEATAVLDRQASWLQLRLEPVFEHDLYFAEIVCCAEFDWA